MDNRIAKVASAMMVKNRGDRRRIEHSLKVYGYARLLGQAELPDRKMVEILEVTALLHDIGIPVAEKKYGKCSSQDQEVEGPPVAREILSALDYSPEFVDRVCWMISKHHTLTAIDDLDFQLLVEADFLVNASEDAMTSLQIANFSRNVFKTETGFAFLRMLFPNLDF